jgi:signal peptidase I
MKATKWNFSNKINILLFFGYTAVATFVVAFLVYYKPLLVSGSSMYPTLDNNDRIIVDKFTGDISTIHRGDVIVFYSPFDDNLMMVKRVIGISGDIIAIEDGKVFVNNIKIAEPYRNNEMLSHETLPAYKVPENSVFVLGDNRLVSSDSREWGAVTSDKIYGKYVIKLGN